MPLAVISLAPGDEGDNHEGRMAVGILWIVEDVPQTARDRHILLPKRTSAEWPLRTARGTWALVIDPRLSENNRQRKGDL